MPPRAKNSNAPAADDVGWVHYVEPYFGGGSVLLAQDPEGISEVANDRHRRLTNFWRTLRDQPQFGKFQSMVQTVPFSAVEYRDYQEAGEVELDQIYDAVAFFVHCRQSMSGRMDNFAPLTRNRTRRGMNEQASAWLNAVEGLPEVHRRLIRVVILNDDALNVIRQQDGPRTLFYLDPPYLHETRATNGEYQHEMSAGEHAALLNVLGEIEGRFLLSGYPSDLYEAARLRNGWRVVTKEIDNKSSSKREKEIKTECLWCNF